MRTYIITTKFVYSYNLLDKRLNSAQVYDSVARQRRETPLFFAVINGPEWAIDGRATEPREEGRKGE